MATLKTDNPEYLQWFDGERNEKKYTVFITFPSNKNKEMIRADENFLNDALIKVLNKYISRI